MNFKNFLIISILAIVFFSSKLQSEELNYLKLKLNKKNFLILNHLVKENKKKKILIQKNNKKLKSDLEINNKIVPATIWLDGLGEEHYNNINLESNTFEVRTKKNSYILNSKKFRILSPSAFKFDYPITYNKILAYFKIPTRYILPINFSITKKKSKKIFLLEEKIGEDFLDKNFLRQSIIFERNLYDNNEYFDILYKERNKIISLSKRNEYLKDLANKNKYQLKTINKAPNNLVSEYSQNLFISYLKKEKKPEEVFDLNQVSKIFAIHTIINSFHALEDHNVKFYFNPFNKKILVIPTDPFNPKKIDELNFSKYIKNDLKKIFMSRDNFVPTLWYEDLIKDKEFRKYYFHNLNKIISDQYFLKFLDKISFIFSEKRHLQDIIQIKKNIKFLNSELKDNYNLAEKTLNKLIKSEKLDKSLKFDHINKKIYLKKNLVDKPIIIKRKFENYEFIIDRKNTIFTNGGSLIINSNFSCSSDQNKNIIIADSKDNFIYFFGPKTFINNCEFKNFNFNNVIEKQFLTSPITFYKTNLILKNSIFKNSKTEDLVNIVDSKVEIENVIIENSISDALDIDNSYGKIANLKIKDCKNDCLDFSSSKFIITDLFIDNSQDKGISGGEKSFINISNSIVQNCNLICLAVKDSSIVKIDNIEFKNGKIGIAQYIKKKIFNSPILSYQNLKFEKIISDIKKEDNLEKILN